MMHLIPVGAEKTRNEFEDTRFWLEQLCKVWSVCGEKLFKLDGLKDEYKAEIEQFQSKSEEILREIEALTPQTVIKCELETNN